MRIDEENYIEELKSGKQEALNYIVDKYLPLVKGTSIKVLGIFKDDGLIEESINDVFLSIWKNSKSFNGEEVLFKAWVYKISKMKAIDYYRKKIKVKEELKEEIILNGKNSIEDELLILEDKKEILNKIRNLEKLDRDIFIMKYFLEMKSSEIGVEKSLSETAVNNRLFRGKKKLKEKLKHFNFGGVLR